jgi:hypothetical protein
MSTSSRAIAFATLVTAVLWAAAAATGTAAAATGTPSEPPEAPAEEGGEAGDASDEDRVTFGIGPASGGGADDRPYITYGAAPGAVIFDSVAIVNQSDQPLELLVYSADGVTTEAGGLDVRERQDSSTGLGSWMTIADETVPVTVTIPPQTAETGRGEVVLPVQIAIPQDAPPGDHVAGVVASLVSLSENAEAQNIELEQRVAARFYVRVDGPLEPALDVEILDVAYTAGSNLWDGGTAEVTYRVTNQGNTRLGASAAVEVAGPFGVGAVATDGPEVVELVPNGGTATLTTTVSDVPALLRMTATVDVTALAAPGAEQFDVGDTDLSSFWATHWQLLVLVLLALLLVVLVVVLVRRRRSRRSRPPGTTADAESERDPSVTAA